MMGALSSELCAKELLQYWEKKKLHMESAALGLKEEILK